MSAFIIKTTIVEEILASQEANEKFSKLVSKFRKIRLRVSLFKDGSLDFKGRWCRPEGNIGLKDKIMRELHITRYSVHRGGEKMY